MLIPPVRDEQPSPLSQAAADASVGSGTSGSVPGPAARGRGDAGPAARGGAWGARAAAGRQRGRGSKPAAGVRSLGCPCANPEKGEFQTHPRIPAWQGWQGPLWVPQPSPLPKQGHPEQGAQHHVQAVTGGRSLRPGHSERIPPGGSSRLPGGVLPGLRSGQSPGGAGAGPPHPPSLVRASLRPPAPYPSGWAARGDRAREARGSGTTAAVGCGGLYSVAAWKRPPHSPPLQTPTLGRTNGLCRIKQRAENPALTAVRNVSCLGASPWARSAGTGAVRGRHQGFQSRSERAGNEPRYTASAGVCLVRELLLCSRLCVRATSPPCQTHRGSSGLRGCGSRQHLLRACSLMN